MARVLQADTVDMADDGRALAALGPVAAGGVAAGGRVVAVGIAAGQDVMLVDRITPAGDDAALFRECRLLVQPVLV